MNSRVVCRLLQNSKRSGKVPFLHGFRNRHRCLNISRYSTLVRDETISLLEGKMDRHNGVHVQLNDLNPEISLKDFNDRLEVSLREWKSKGIFSAWLNIPVMMSSFIPIAAQHGFVFHHAEGDRSAMYCWLEEGRVCQVPRFASHQVGAAGCVVNESSMEVLMVQDKKSPVSAYRPFWKFPGGLSELGEDISETAQREVYEETGIQSEFQGLLGFRQQHNMPNAFGRSDLFFICHMKPTSFELHPDYDHEISKCQWMKIPDVLKDPATSPFSVTICKLMENGIKNGFSSIHFSTITLKSVYKSVPFLFYCPRDLTDKTN